MSVEEIMSTDLVSVGMDDSLKKVQELFQNNSFHHLLVVGAGKLLGVISDRDLLKEISPNLGTSSESAVDLAVLKKRVHQIMTRKPITLPKNAGVYHAIKIFNKHSISCIPIVDDDFKPVGIISWRDIFKSIEARRNKAANTQ